MSHFPKYMDLENYRNSIRELDMYPDSVGLAMLALGLAGEAGEIANKVKKVYRDNTEIPYEALLSECGDTLWYLTRIIDTLQAQVGEVAASNYAKLIDRRLRNVLQGSGDNR